MLKTWLDSELIRYNKHPVLWSIALGISAAFLYKEIMDDLVYHHNIR